MQLYNYTIFVDVTMIGCICFLMRKSEKNSFVSKPPQFPIIIFWILNLHIIMCQFRRKKIHRDKLILSHSMFLPLVLYNYTIFVDVTMIGCIFLRLSAHLEHRPCLDQNTSVINEYNQQVSNKSGTGGRRYFLLSTHNTHTRFSQAFKLHSVEKNTSKFQAHIILAISEFVPIYSFIHTSDPFLNWQFDIPYWRESRPFPELILHSTELRLKGI